MGAVDQREGLPALLFAAEQLYHRHAGEALLQEGVDLRHPAPGVAEGGPRPPPEPVGEHEEEGDHGEGDQSQAPTEAQHHDHDPDQGEEVADHRHHPRGEEVVDGVDVSGDPGDQPPHRVAVEVAHVQPLQVRVDLPPHVLHDPLAGHLHDLGL